MRKHEEAAVVIGAGVLASGSGFYLVSSQSDPGRSHVVEQQPTRLRCDCKSHRYRRRCGHIAAVVTHKQSLQATWADAEAKGAESESHASPDTHATPRHLGDTAILRRNNRPFTILA